jgi:diguanylate cyclase (GGDEF)-like protein
MDSHWQCENFSLRQQLEGLLHQARLNEGKMRRFDQLERQLIGARSLLELIDLLLNDYKAAFGIEFVSLALVDPEYEIARLIDIESTESGQYPHLHLLEDSSRLEKLYPHRRNSLLTAFDPAQHQSLFNAPAAAIASIALLPLIRQGELIGSLHLGSASAERYAADVGTDFLERLSGIVAICLDSALAQERLKRAGLTDSLTGVQNRRYFEHRCQVEISQAARHKQPLACLFLDIDKFKRINDKHGHQTGDAVLRSIAGIIQAQLRTSDTIARYGGEEFVTLLPQTAGHYALEIAERIRLAVANTAFRSQAGEALQVTISIGLAMLPMEPGKRDIGSLAEKLVASADKALYQAKHNGRNRVVSVGLAPTRALHRTTWHWLRGQLNRLGADAGKHWRNAQNLIA